MIVYAHFRIVGLCFIKEVCPFWFFAFLSSLYANSWPFSACNEISTFTKHLLRGCNVRFFTRKKSIIIEGKCRNQLNDRLKRQGRFLKGEKLFEVHLRVICSRNGQATRSNSTQGWLWCTILILSPRFSCQISSSSETKLFLCMRDWQEKQTLTKKSFNLRIDFVFITWTEWQTWRVQIMSSLFVKSLSLSWRFLDLSLWPSVTTRGENCPVPDDGKHSWPGFDF